MTNFTRINEAVEQKFGQLESCLELRANEYRIAIKRDNPTFSDRPFMTIRAAITEKEVHFYWGHYDLTQERMHALMTGDNNHFSH